jgi:hypothetical protein
MRKLGRTPVVGRACRHEDARSPNGRLVVPVGETVWSRFAGHRTLDLNRACSGVQGATAFLAFTAMLAM